MTVDLEYLAQLTEADLRVWAEADPDAYDEMLAQIASEVLRDQQENALASYQMVNPMTEPLHRSTAREACAVGGNRSGKTESALVELAIATTGRIPESLKAWYPREKVRPPIRALVMCNSLIDTLPMLHQKLQWHYWSGPGSPEDGRGHWGWLPRWNLQGGSWEKAYSEKYRTLRVKVDGMHRYSTVSFGSFDQEPASIAGKSYHLIINDEFPPAELYREERMRTLDVQGRILTAFTPPDESGTNRGDVSWFHDQVYERGLEGLGKDPDIDTVILWTDKNRILSPADVQQIVKGYTEDQLQARLYGKFLHLSGVVYPLFTQHPAAWCFRCQKRCFPAPACPACGGDDLEPFCHVVSPWEVPKGWPVVFVIDPHPRKPDACGWFTMTPSDDVIMTGELEAVGDAGDVTQQIFQWEHAHRVSPVLRLMDPNIATETNDRLERGWTLRMAYDRAGLRCDLANDSVPVGIQNVGALLKPDPLTRRPRFTTFATNRKFIYGMTHWAYDEWQRNAGDKEPKEIVRDRWKDWPDLIRYLANSCPDYRALVRGGHSPMRMAVPTRGY